MKRTRVSLAGLLCITLAATGTSLLATPASAAVCPGSQTHDNKGIFGVPPDNEIGGVRAPIQARLDGTVCSAAPFGPDSFSAAWLAVEEGNTGNGISQIGITHIYSGLLGSAGFCKFWAIGSGTDYHLYGCNTLTDGAYTHFKILKYLSAGGVLRYEIDDCGASGYSGCTNKSSEQVKYSTEEWAFDQETNYGGVGVCTNRFMGTTGNPVNIGRSGDQYQTMPDYNSGNWINPNNWQFTSQDCLHYGFHLNTGGGIMTTWDDRNTS